MILCIYIILYPEWHSHSSSFSQSEALVSQPAIGLLLRCQKTRSVEVVPEPPGDPVGRLWLDTGTSNKLSRVLKPPKSWLENGSRGLPVPVVLEICLKDPPVRHFRPSYEARETLLLCRFRLFLMPFAKKTTWVEHPEHGKRWAVSKKRSWEKNKKGQNAPLIERS